MKDFLGFFEYQEIATLGLGYLLTLQRESDKKVLGHEPGADQFSNDAMAGRIVIDDVSWYVPYNNPNLSEQNLFSGILVSRAASNITNSKRSFLTKKLLLKTVGLLNYEYEENLMSKVRLL